MDNWNNGPSVGLTPKIRIIIDVLPDNRIEVSGFPTNLNTTMEIMASAIRRVAAFFVGMARDGKVDENGTLEQPMIVPASAIPKQMIGPN